MKNPIALLVMFCAFALGLVAVRNQMATHAAVAEAPVENRKASSPARPAQVVTDPAMLGRTAYLRKEDNGHYWTNARINGATIRLMVDSGAAVVALTKADARKLHIDIGNLKYDREMITAGGHIRAASVTLDEITIERVKVTNVEAVVMTEGLETSLLGMTFLNRLTNWQATPRAIMIRQ